MTNVELELLQQFSDLRDSNPERFEQVYKEHPEWFKPVLDLKRQYELIERINQDDSPESFFAYFEGKYKFKPQQRIKRWVKKAYEAHNKNMGFTLNGYRGSRKTVSFGATFLEYRIGKEPHKTNLVVTASDATSDEIIENITQTIEFHPFWKKVFGNVAPDKGRWSSDGYYVIDNSISREEWTAKQSATKDPTLVGGGYTSVRINGKHPSGVLLTDDLHSINNSTSESQLKFISKFYTTELSRTMIHDKGKMITWAVNIGVPWGDDVHKALGQSGAFLSESLPVMTRAKEGDDDAVYIDGINKITGTLYEDIVGWWIIDEESDHDVDSIIMARGYGKRDFWQMMMMDLVSALSGSIRYYGYRPEYIDKNWYTVSGVDPSQTFKERKEPIRGNSYFAIANVVRNPRGGLIIEGGRLAQCTINEAAGLMVSTKQQFSNHQGFYVENVGFGMAFKEQLVRLFPQLVVVGSDLGGIRLKGEKAAKVKNKIDRAKDELEPYFENGSILVSDENTEFLNVLRDALRDIMELDPHVADKRLDVLDAVYHGVKAQADALYRHMPEQDLSGLFRKKEKAPHPLSGRRNR